MRIKMMRICLDLTPCMFTLYSLIFNKMTYKFAEQFLTRKKIPAFISFLLKAMEAQASTKDDVEDEETFKVSKQTIVAKNTTIEEILLAPVENSSQRLNLPVGDISDFTDRIRDKSIARLKKTEKTLSLEVNTPTMFTTGDEKMDRRLNGGFPVGYLIEIAGKASTGKTNTLLQLAISIQLPREFGGLGPKIYHSNKRPRISETNPVKTLYISTEGLLPTTRIEEIASHFSAMIELNGIERNEVNEHLFPSMSNVITAAKVPTSLEEQDHILFYQVPALLNREKGVKLLILDSITHHVRVELNWLEQQRYIKNICKYLKKLANQYNITVIISNQVTDKPIHGIFRGPSGDLESTSLIWKLNSEYQLAWLEGWDEVGVMYRQLLKREGIYDHEGANFEKLDYLEDYEEERQEEEIDTIQGREETPGIDLKKILKHERRILFDNKYKMKIGGITTRPALGGHLLEYVDMRCVLSRAVEPVFNEELIDEFSTELGIDTTEIEMGEEGKTSNSFMEQLSNNSYLQNENFQWYRVMVVPFGPMIKSGGISIDYQIWKGGIRYKEN